MYDGATSPYTLGVATFVDAASLIEPGPVIPNTAVSRTVGEDIGL
jgi:hypothetical protein